MTPRELARLYETLVRDAPDAIVYADQEGVIRFWNRGTERTFGFSAAEAIGKSLDPVIPERLRGRHWEGYRHVMETGVTRYGAGDLLAVAALRKGGEQISIEFTIVPLRNQAGGMCGVAAIMRDVTKRFEETKELRRKLAAASSRS